MTNKKPSNWEELEPWEKSQYVPDYVDPKADFWKQQAIQEDAKKGQVTFSYGDRQKLDSLILAGNWSKAKKLASETEFSQVDKNYFNSIINKRNSNDREFAFLHGKELLSLVLKKAYTEPAQPAQSMEQLKPKSQPNSLFTTIIDYLIIGSILIMISHIILMRYAMTEELALIAIFFLVLGLFVKKYLELKNP